MLQSELTPDGWRLESGEVLGLLAKLRSAGLPLGEFVKGRFYRGILTGFNEAFVVDRVTRDRLVAEDARSAEVLKPYLRGRDVKRWVVNDPDLWLLFIPWHFPLHEDPTISGVSEKAEKEFKKQYPAIYNHLLQYKDQLSNRNKAETGIRYEWYALQRCAASYFNEIAEDKIIIPAISQVNDYASDSNGSFGNDKTSICISEQKIYLLGILNSKPSLYFISSIAASRQGGFLEFKPVYVTQIPIPDPKKDPDRIAQIESLVQQILDRKQTNPAADVSAIEREIDQHVYQLYDLTIDEIQIIETSTR
jgi:hypothetical protein